MWTVAKILAKIRRRPRLDPATAASRVQNWSPQEGFLRQCLQSNVQDLRYTPVHLGFAPIPADGRLDDAQIEDVDPCTVPLMHMDRWLAWFESAGRPVVSVGLSAKDWGVARATLVQELTKDGGDPSLLSVRTEPDGSIKLAPPPEELLGLAEKLRMLVGGGGAPGLSVQATGKDEIVH